MAPQDWESPATFGAPAAAPAYAAPDTAAYAMRPLSTGEVLDRTFSIYRSRFWLFAGLASLSGVWSLILNSLQLFVRHYVLVHHGFRDATLESQFSGLIVMLLGLPVSAVVYAASVFALCEVYLGRAVDAKSALQATAGRWLRYVGISIWWGFSALWLFLLLAIPAFVLILMSGMGAMAAVGGLLIFAAVFGGGAYAVIAYIRNSLAIPATVMENSGVRASMRRSKTLAAGTKGRIFVLFLIVVALYIVAATIESPVLFVIARNPVEEHIAAQAVVLAVAFLSSTLVSPVALIGLTLIYFDQRVRHEAFDLFILMGPETPVAVVEPVMLSAVGAKVGGPVTESVTVVEVSEASPAVDEPQAEEPDDPADPIRNDGNL